MNAKKYALLINVVLIATATTSIVAAEEIERLRFSASVYGPCFVLYGQGVEGGSSPFPEPIYYAGSGYGRARISGLAKDNIPYTSFLGEGYSSECPQYSGELGDSRGKDGTDRPFLWRQRFGGHHARGKCRCCCRGQFSHVTGRDHRFGEGCRVSACQKVNNL